jgi:hypothetical protein
MAWRAVTILLEAQSSSSPKIDALAASADARSGEAPVRGHSDGIRVTCGIQCIGNNRSLPAPPGLVARRTPTDGSSRPGGLSFLAGLLVDAEAVDSLPH